MKQDEIEVSCDARWDEEEKERELRMVLSVTPEETPKDKSGRHSSFPLIILSTD